MGEHEDAIDRVVAEALSELSEIQINGKRGTHTRLTPDECMESAMAITRAVRESISPAAPVSAGLDDEPR